MTLACCPGSFDPVTNGHIDIIERALRVFEEVVVLVVENPGKRGMFTVDERIEMLRDVTSELDGIKIASFQGLTVDFCKQVGADVIVKGLRAVSDFDFEMQMAHMNSRMGVDTCFIPTKARYSYLSSSLMKEVVRYGGTVEGLLPPDVERRLRERIAEADG